MKAFVCAAALLSSVSFAEADPVPDELLGYFGSSPLQCRSYHRKVDDVTQITKETYTTCSGVSCEHKILGVAPIADGYEMTFAGKEGTVSSKIIRVLPGVFESDGETLVRCGNADKIAGIGRPIEFGLEITKAPAVLFSAFYAMALPKRCASIVVDQKQADRIAAIGMTEYLKFLQTNGNELTGHNSPDAVSEWQQREASYAVEQDADEIENFCSLVLDVFGPAGSLIPELISDGSQGL